MDDVRASVAAQHHFDTWDEYEAFARELRDDTSPTAQFEAAVDAVVRGDEATLDRLLRARPELIHARSTRSHHATLLLYVGANGVEGFRQKTPKNAVRIAERLLAAGADVDAVGDMYRGTTTLGLVATSVHPVIAGVQAELIDVLIGAGASLARAVAPDYTNGRVVNACLANGRGEGAELVAARGAELDLEGAAGVGRLDVVKTFFDERGELTAGTPREQLLRGALWAGMFGRLDVIEFLLDGRIDPAESRGHETMLHGAALGGHAAVVRTLIAHGAPIDVKDDHYHATPLGWALHGWGHRGESSSPEPYYDVVRQLVAAGARVEDDVLTDEYISADPLIEDRPMTIGSTLRREARVALSKKAQPVWFRLIKWAAIIVCGVLFWRSVVFWRTMGVLLIVALTLHVIWRWKTKAWTQPWGGWNDLDAGR